MHKVVNQNTHRKDNAAQAPRVRYDQNFSIRFFRTVHMRARLPNMYIGIADSRHTSWMPPNARNTVRAPSDSSQSTIKREKIRPWKISVGSKLERKEKYVANQEKVELTFAKVQRNESLSSVLPIAVDAEGNGRRAPQAAPKRNYSKENRI